MMPRKLLKEDSMMYSMDGAEKFMEKFIIFIDEYIYDMINSVESNNFEDAELYRKEIEKVINKSKKTILSKGWTKFNEEDLDDFLNKIKDDYIVFWENLIISDDKWKIK